MKPSDNERRERFRMEDTAILEVKPVTLEQMQSMPAERQFDESASFVLMRELRNIDHESRILLKNIGDRNPELGNYLASLNKKIDAIARSSAEDMLMDPQQLQVVDLSEGGIGFNHFTALEEGKDYVIKIWFHQNFSGVAAYIRVVACHRAIDGGYHISSAFQSLAESDEQVISRHIMQLQARQQREKRQSGEE